MRETKKEEEYDMGEVETKGRNAGRNTWQEVTGGSEEMGIRWARMAPSGRHTTEGGKQRKEK
jgi:hypothetical protein